MGNRVLQKRVKIRFELDGDPDHLESMDYARLFTVYHHAMCHAYKYGGHGFAVELANAITSLKQNGMYLEVVWRTKRDFETLRPYFDETWAQMNEPSTRSVIKYHCVLHRVGREVYSELTEAEEEETA